MFKTALSTLGLICLTCDAAWGSTPWTSGYDWTLVFEDDFSESSLDSYNWSRIDYVNYAVSDWRKYQSQDESLITFNEADSTITLWGRYGDYTTQSNQTSVTSTYACAGIYSLKTFKFQYGYVEVKAKFDSVQGVWPAIWLMPTTGPWPSTGEIDIMEHLNYQGSVYQTLHYTDSSGNNTAPYVHPQIDKTVWNTYGMEWTEDSITFYINGVATGTFSKNSNNWPFDDENNEFYLIIDQQIGGTWVENTGQNSGIDQNTLATNGAAFEIDYVKVYSTSNYMHLQSVPESSSCCMALAGLTCLLLSRRRNLLSQ